MDEIVDTVKDTLKRWGREEWIYWTYSKIMCNIQMYRENIFEATRIVDNLWLGSLESSCNREALQERNIETIISAILGASAMFPFDFKYERAKLRDVEDEDIKEEFEKLLPVIRKELVNNRGVLCHCHAGRSRSASIVAAYLIKYHHMTCEEAINYIRERRTQIDPNPGYIEQLKEFEMEVRSNQIIDTNKKEK